MATIVEFALKEEPLDVEKMRKCLLKQVQLNFIKTRIIVYIIKMKNNETCQLFHSWKEPR